jgi:hypothetical protein
LNQYPDQAKGNRVPPKDRRIISNDDGWIMSNMTGPVTAETIKERMVDTYPGSPIGGICDSSSCINSVEHHVGAFRYANPWASLPVFMEETRANGGSALILDIADDVEAARADGSLTACTLSLGFDNINDGDELDVRLNGESVSWKGRQVATDGWGYTLFDGLIYLTTMSEERVEGTLIKFDVTGLLFRKGENELVVRLIKGRGPHPHTKPVTLTAVRLEIEYA